MNPESVVTQRLEDVVPLKPLESSIYVVPHEREEVAHMQPLRGRVREHHQRIERVRSVGYVSGIGVLIAPALLPLQLYLGWVVTRGFLGRVGIHHVGHGYKVAVPSITFIIVMHQLSPMGPSLELAEAERAYTPSWDGIPVVEMKSRGLFSLMPAASSSKHGAFAVIFSISVLQVSIGWVAYRLFHLLSPDVQRAFLASTDVRWTLIVGARLGRRNAGSCVRPAFCA